MFNVDVMPYENRLVEAHYNPISSFVLFIEKFDTFFHHVGDFLICREKNGQQNGKLSTLSNDFIGVPC